MRYRVVWVSEAEQELARLWLNTAFREAVTAAAFQLERLLEEQPEEAGESRSTGRRILLNSPLGITYEVLADEGVVRVLTIWRFEKHR